jgi:ribosomal protein S18 acetylase RimI-like enzyme
VPSLRRAVSGDVPDLASLAKAAYGPYVERIGREPAPMTADYAALVNDAEVWVADDTSAVVGLLVLVAADDHLALENVAVLPEAQGHGIGCLLLAHAERRAGALGLAEVRLYTNEKMTENLAFYPRRGYVETRRAGQAGFGRVFFAKRVAQDPAIDT